MTERTTKEDLLNYIQQADEKTAKTIFNIIRKYIDPNLIANSNTNVTMPMQTGTQRHSIWESTKENARAVINNQLKQ